MNYGDIIKKAWGITWRHRALWVLGLFAGVSGWSAGGGGSRGGGSSSSSTNASGLRSLENTWVPAIERVLPMIVAGIVVLLLVGLVLWAVGIAARGGLIHVVNELEEGRPVQLRAAWAVGFDKFWRLLGLSLLLSLPIAILSLALAFAILVPLFASLLRGAEPTGAIVAPLCGTLAIGVPLLIVASFVLGIMYLVAIRFVVLYDMRVFQAAGEAWRAFRGRLKDHLLMWLINWGLNIVAGIALAIPVTILAVAIIVPGVLTLGANRWGQFIGMVVVFVVVVFLISLFFTAVWGTFTSALWTIFFRRLVGFEVEPVVYAPPRWDGRVPPSGSGLVPPAQPMPWESSAPVAPVVPSAPPAPPTPPVAPPSDEAQSHG